MGVRHELRDLLEANVPGVPAFAELPRESGVPFLAIAPGRPDYRRRPDSVASRTGCLEITRLEVIAAVSKESATALDELDALADGVRAAIAALPGARWLGITAGREPDSIGGTPVYRQNTALEVSR
jgi:hypothetical protein